MAIDGGLRNKLQPGTKLVARYKGTEHTAEVLRDAEGRTRYRLADGREFKSPSAAGSAVMGGTACNGWRWWTVAGTPEARPSGSPGARPSCARCGKTFVSAKNLAHHTANAERLCSPKDGATE